MRLRMRPRPEGFRRIRSRLDALKLDAGDRQALVLRTLDAVHVVQVKRAFASRGGTVASGPWPPWSPKYAKWRAQHRRGANRLMRLTDTLYEKSTSPRHGGHVARWLGRLRYAFGFIDDVGYLHQIGAGPLPVRSVLDKTGQDYREFSDAFVRMYQARVRQVLRHV